MESEKCMFKRKHRLLHVGNRQEKRHRVKQTRYMCKEEHRVKEKDPEFF